VITVIGVRKNLTRTPQRMPRTQQNLDSLRDALREILGIRSRTTRMHVSRSCFSGWDLTIALNTAQRRSIYKRR
jgi:hypothetical protein